MAENDWDKCKESRPTSKPYLDYNKSKAIYILKNLLKSDSDDLEFGMAARHNFVHLLSTYLRAKFHPNRKKNLFMDGWTYGCTDIEIGYIKPITHRRRRRDATKQFRLVGVGGVYWLGFTLTWTSRRNQDDIGLQ